MTSFSGRRQLLGGASNWMVALTAARPCGPSGMKIAGGAAALVVAAAPDFANASFEIDHTAIFDTQARISSCSATNDYAGQVFLDGTVLESELRFSRSLSLFVNTVLESVTDVDLQENSFFEGHGAFIQESFLLWDNGFNRQSRPEASVRDQTGTVLAARQVYEIKGIQIAATVEWARFANFGAEMSRATYLTPAIEFSWESLGAAVIYSERRQEILFSDNLLELNASLTIREGPRIDLSWAELDIDDKGSASLGFGFSYTHEF